MKEEKRHVGRPTNEEVKKRRNKKMLKILVPIIIIIILVAITGKLNLINLKGSSNIKCESEYIECKNKKECTCRSKTKAPSVYDCKSGYVVANGTCYKIIKPNLKCPKGYTVCKNQKNCECKKITKNTYKSDYDCFMAINSVFSLYKNGKCYRTALKIEECPSGSINCNNPKNCKCKAIKPTYNVATKCKKGYVLENGNCYENPLVAEDKRCKLSLTPDKNSLKVNILCGEGADFEWLVLKNKSGAEIGYLGNNDDYRTKNRIFKINKLDKTKYYVEIAYSTSQSDGYKFVQKSAIIAGDKINYFGLTKNEICNIKPYLDQQKLKNNDSSYNFSYDVQCGVNARACDTYFVSDKGNAQKKSPIYKKSFPYNDSSGYNSYDSNIKNYEWKYISEQELSGKKYIKLYYKYRNNDTGLDYIVRTIRFDYNKLKIQ